jgi:hypothetical protein
MSIAGLSGGTTYHYRIVSAAGAGSDATFKTIAAPLTLPAVSVTSTSAILKGLDSNAGESYHFEYGTTTAYGHSTATATAPGSLNDLSASVTGLTPGTTYHYRIVSTSGSGRDATFTTTQASGGGGGGGGGGKPAHDLVLGLHGPATGKVGKPLRFVATIANKGTKTVAGAKLKLVFRGGTVQVAAPHGCKGGGALTCSLPKILTGKAVRVTVVIHLAAAAKLTVTGSLLTTFTDPTPTNNRATRHTTVK